MLNRDFRTLVPFWEQNQNSFPICKSAYLNWLWVDSVLLARFGVPNREVQKPRRCTGRFAVFAQALAGRAIRVVFHKWPAGCNTDCVINWRTTVNDDERDKLQFILHELSNLLTGVLVAGGLLQHALKGDPREHYAREVTEGSERCAALVREGRNLLTPPEERLQTTGR